MVWLRSTGFFLSARAARSHFSRQASTVSRSEEQRIGDAAKQRLAQGRVAGDEELKPTTLQIGAGLAVVAIVAKLVMMYDESVEPERVAQKARKIAKEQETLKPYTREEWDELQSLRPRTPFESSLGRDGARIRSGEPVSLEDLRNWVIDVFMEALHEREDAVSRLKKRW